MLGNIMNYIRRFNWTTGLAVAVGLVLIAPLIAIENLIVVGKQMTGSLTQFGNYGDRHLTGYDASIPCEDRTGEFDCQHNDDGNASGCTYNWNAADDKNCSGDLNDR